MKLHDYITNDVQSLTLNSSILDAKNAFNLLTFSHLPVTENGILIGSISESDVRSIDDDEKKIGSFREIFAPFFASEANNWMEVLKIFASNETTVIPVLDKEKKYIGYYELTEILHFFNETHFLATEGFILVVEKGTRDYSMSEIAQITESNNAQLLGCFTSQITNNMMRVTLKIASEEINELIQTFRRYDYNVLTQHEDDSYLEDLKERSDYLQKYLNM